MVRTILKSNQNDLTIHLPDDLVGKTIEIIAFEISDEIKKNQSERFPKPSQLRGFLSKEVAQSMHDHIKESRKEWDTL